MTNTMLPPLLLVGAGRMGGAMFAGWVKRGLAPSALVDPALGGNLPRADDIALLSIDALPKSFAPAAVILAVKPQMADAVLASLTRVLQPGTLLLSIMAGRKITAMANAVGGAAAIVRAMPNMPASIGQGMTVACAGPDVTPAQKLLCDDLLCAVGKVAWVEDEAQLDPVTAISGSGPAYVFLLAELLEQFGIERGLPPALARTLARKTISGAGALVATTETDTADLRRAVTSPGGTTEAALTVLMAPDAWPRTLAAALDANMSRARELET